MLCFRGSQACHSLTVHPLGSDQMEYGISYSHQVQTEFSEICPIRGTSPLHLSWQESGAVGGISRRDLWREIRGQILMSEVLGVEIGADSPIDPGGHTAV